MKKYGKPTKTKEYSTENKALFDYHYEKFPEFFQTYKDNPIEYVLSAKTQYDGRVATFDKSSTETLYSGNLWFRTPISFDKNKKVKVDIFLGCSHTFGIGHHEENLWVSKVAETTGNIPVNLGTPGRGTSQSYMNLVNYADLWDVQNIFHFQPYYPRYDDLLLDYRNMNYYRKFTAPKEVWTTHHVNVQGTTGIGTGTTFGEREVYTRDYIETTMVTERYMKNHHNKHVYACAGYAASKGINYYHRHTWPATYSTDGLIDREYNSELEDLTILNIRAQEYVKTLTLARDGSHMTVQTQQEIGEEFIEMYSTDKDNKGVGVIEPLQDHNAQLARKLTREKSWEDINPGFYNWAKLRNYDTNPAIIPLI